MTNSLRMMTIYCGETAGFKGFLRVKPTNHMSYVYTHTAYSLGFTLPPYKNVIKINLGACHFLVVCWFHVTGEIPTKYLLADRTYEAYLIYMVRKQANGFQDREQSSSIRLRGERVLSNSMVCLCPPGDLVPDDNVTMPLKRKDGWFEIKLGEFTNNAELQEQEAVIADVYQTDDYSGAIDIIIEGMEFRLKSC
uniref:Uncharacterized protein n=1 Tax=Oryza brachyantha TaxID=4533 RepID=J3N6Y5_ORYBR